MLFYVLSFSNSTFDELIGTIPWWKFHIGFPIPRYFVLFCANSDHYEPIRKTFFVHRTPKVSLVSVVSRAESLFSTHWCGKINFPHAKRHQLGYLSVYLVVSRSCVKICISALDTKCTILILLNANQLKVNPIHSETFSPN